MAEAFPKWFGEAEGEVKPFNKVDFEIDIFWNKIIGNVAKNSGYNVSDLSKMNVTEFFITVSNLEIETKRHNKQAKK